MKIAVIIAAAGSGRRMGAPVNKVLLPLAGRPLLAWSLALFQADPAVGRILVTAAPEDRAAFLPLLADFPKAALVPGGDTRQASVENALARLTAEQDPAAPWDKVAVHDGARPLLSSSDWQRLLAVAETCPAALLAGPVTDTVKRTEGSQVLATLDREALAAAQTPQIFDFPLLVRAYAEVKAQGLSATDDASLAEALGLRPRVLWSLDPNFKVTYPWDLAAAEQVIRERNN